MKHTGYLRPHNKDRYYKNIYYTGSSTIPGIGLPMSIISSKLTYDRFMSDINYI